MTDYIKWLRSKVGHDPILLNAAGAFVTNERGQILLLRRGQGEKQNSWTVPGGIMELGETPREAAKREVLEETGLEVEIGDLVGVYTNTIPVTYPNGDACQMIDLFFTSRVVGGSIKVDGGELLEIRFFDTADRPTLFRPHVERALQDFEKGLHGLSD